MDIYLELIRYDSNTEGKNRSSVDFMKNIMLGGASAAVGKTLFAPIERVKLLLQLQESKSVKIDQSKKYKGAIDCLIRIPKEEGFRGYLKGNLVNVLRYFPNQALSFAFRDVYKKIFLKDIDRRRDIKLYFWMNVAAGAAAGATALCFVYPLDFARTRISLDLGKPEQQQYKNLRHCLKKLYKSDGFFGLYSGFRMSALGITWYRGVSFGIYDFGRGILDPNKDNIWMSVLLAQISTIFASFVTYPLDTVSRRLMMESGLKPEDRHYRNSLHCFATMIKEEGFKSLFKGALVNIFRCTGSALVLVIFEEAKKWI